MIILNEQERKKISEQAKAILDGFSKTLEKVKIEKKEFKKYEGGFREERAGAKGNASFREIMFENAPLKTKDSIIAEKKKW